MVGRCGICFDEFNGSTIKPKSLPCGHSYCLKCLHTLRPRQCPVCKKAYEMHQLRDNFALMDEPVVNISPKASQDPNREVLLKVHTMNGRKFALKMRLSSKVRDLKEAITDRSGIAVSNQNLIYGGRKLDNDNEQLSGYRLSDESVIQVGVMSIGGKAGLF